MRKPVTNTLITQISSKQTHETLNQSDELRSGFRLSNNLTVIKEPIRNNPQQVTLTDFTFNKRNNDAINEPWLSSIHVDGDFNVDEKDFLTFCKRTSLSFDISLFSLS